MHIMLLFVLALSGLVWGIVNLQRELRRREWAKKNITPLFSIEGPRELAATLAYALLKCGGDLTSDQKQALLQVYEDELKFSRSDANEMYSYASYLIGTDPNYATKVREIAAPALDKFSSEQRDSTVAMLHKPVVEPTVVQTEFVNQVRVLFTSQHP